MNGPVFLDYLEYVVTLTSFSPKDGALTILPLWRAFNLLSAGPTLPDVHNCNQYYKKYKVLGDESHNSISLSLGKQTEFVVRNKGDLYSRRP